MDAVDFKGVCVRKKTESERRKIMSLRNKSCVFILQKYIGLLFPAVSAVSNYFNGLGIRRPETMDKYLYYKFIQVLFLERGFALRIKY